MLERSVQREIRYGSIVLFFSSRSMSKQFSGDCPLRLANMNSTTHDIIIYDPGQKHKTHLIFLVTAPRPLARALRRVPGIYLLHLAFHSALQHVREVRSYRDADDAQQSHRRHRLQQGRTLRSVHMPGTCVRFVATAGKLRRFLLFVLLPEVCN